MNHAAVWNAGSGCVLVLALCMALGIPALSQTSAQREIPFENSPQFGLMLVKAEANGRPAVLIVDTAASRTILSSDLAYVTPHVMRNMVSTRKGSGFAGSGILEKATLTIGPLVWRDHRVVVMDTRDLSKSLGQKADGLLGIDFFSEFETVAVDLRRHKLILGPRHSDIRQIQ